MKNNQMDDEAAQKKRGIASADKIGFFERIRMGNIDDPSSEAYKKLGAGRGRSIPEASKIPYTETDDAKNLDKAAMREKSEVTDERDAREAEYAGLPRKTPPMTRKAPIVTKDQMKKEGFDNLRDYLNFKQKKTRRKDPVAKSVDKSTGQPEITLPLYKYNQEIATRSESPNLINNDMTAEQIAAAEKRTMPTDEARFLDASRRGQLGTMKKGGVVKKMKKGGIVSSASKRADGIAVKGKTRGRMV
jgi:hypothetical protein